MSRDTVKMILRLVDLLALGAQLAPDVRARFEATSARVRGFVAEGRDPTPEEWADLDAETEALFRRLQGR